jgi:ATP-dependent helicase HrpB
LLEGVLGLDDVAGEALVHGAMTLLAWPLPRELERLAPMGWITPAGRRVEIDYAAEGGPRVECKVQEAFGLNVHPTIADGRIALTLALLSPALRPVAVTRDVTAFWRSGYHDMRKDMKGRYPKHDWPEDPASAQPTSRAKPRKG